MSLRTGVEVNVVSATLAGGCRLRITFSDGHADTLDFGPFLRSSLNPDVRKYADPEAFRSFEINHGNLVWGDYEMCFPIESLYEGFIGAVTQPHAAVAEARMSYRTKRRTPPGTAT